MRALRGTPCWASPSRCARASFTPCSVPTAAEKPRCCARRSGSSEPLPVVPRSPDAGRPMGPAGLMITHQVNLAARFADQVLILADGRAVARGAPADVLTRETAAGVFQWPVVMSAFEGRPQMIPLRKKENHP